MSSVFIAEDGWCAKDIKDVFLQIDFLLKTRVTRVGVLRRKSKDHWVEKYSLQYSDDDITWTDYMENGHTKVGNIQSRDISIRHFQKGCAKFSPPFCTLSTGNLMEGVRWSIKAGKIRDNQSRLVGCQMSRKLVALVSSESGYTKTESTIFTNTLTDRTRTCSSPRRSKKMVRYLF